MNGGYGIQPNLAVRALLPAPPRITSLARSKSSRERLAQVAYLFSNVTSVLLPCLPSARPQRASYRVYSAYSIPFARYRAIGTIGTIGTIGWWR